MLVTAIQPDEGRLTRPKYRWETKNILFYSSLVVLYSLSWGRVLQHYIKPQWSAMWQTKIFHFIATTRSTTSLTESQVFVAVSNARRNSGRIKANQLCRIGYPEYHCHRGDSPFLSSVHNWVRPMLQPVYEDVLQMSAISIPLFSFSVNQYKRTYLRNSITCQEEDH